MMGIRYFTDEQVKLLEQNPNVKAVSTKSITYTQAFKEQFIKLNQEGHFPRAIFEAAGFEIEVIGMSRIQAAGKRWRKQNLRLEGLKDTRKDESGRPRVRELTQDEIIERQRVEIEYLKQERDFLLELKRLERLAIKNEKSKPKTNTKSSKKS